jgi:MFS transporter, ACS family, glucarate transporter
MAPGYRRKMAAEENAAQSAAPALADARPVPTRVRHAVLGLTVAAYMITYMDRVVISSAVPSIQKEFGFSLVTMGWILSSFQWGYALFQIPGGWLGDRFGARRALAAVVVWWSLFTSATTLAWSAASMVLVRFLFGMGEAGAFPIATRSLSRWTLPSERGFAQGLTHAGSRLGGALTPVIVVLIIARYGWRAPFLCFGCVGIVWSILWHWFYRNSPTEHRSVNRAERDLILSSVGYAAAKKEHPISWRTILASPQMWLLSAMYFCYAYNVSVYLVWYPKYLNSERGFGLERMGLYASLPLLAGTLGDLLGGWLSDLWVKRSGSLARARRVVAVSGFLLAAACILPACYTAGAVASVCFSAAAMFSLELTVGVSWAITLDIGGESAGTVSSVMNTFGNLGGAISSALSAYLVKLYGWNAPFLVVAMLSVAAALLYLRINAGRRLVSV